MNRNPSSENATPLGISNVNEGAKSFTSSPILSPSRSITTQTFSFFVPTKRAVPWGAIAMWRASGTNAYRSIVKPGGSSIVRKMLRIEFAAGPSCAMVVNSVTPVVLNCPSLVKLSSASAPLAKRIADKTGNSCLLRMRFIRTSEYVEGPFYRK